VIGRIFLGQLLSGESIMARAVWVGLLCSAAGSVRALEPFETFVAGAERSAFDLREAALLVEQRDLESSQAWYGLSPALSASGRYTRNQYEAKARIPTGPDTPPRTAVILPKDQAEVTLQASVPLIDVTRWRRISAAERASDAAHESRDATRLLVRRALAQQYYAVVAAEALVQASERAFTAAEKNLQLIQARLSAGVAAELDVRRAEAEVQRNRQILADAVYQVALARRALETLSGRTPSAGAPRLNADLAAEAPLAAWLRPSARDLPEVRALASQSKSALAAADAQRAQLLPALEANASERFTNAPGFGKSPAYAVGVSASLRFDLASVAGARALDKAAQLGALRAERAEREAKDRIHDAWFEVVRQLEKSRAARAQCEAARLATRIAHDRHAAGSASFLDVVLAERDELSADASLIRADADLCRARADLRLLANRPHEPRFCLEAP
jgi:outer membrane protein TolC